MVIEKEIVLNKFDTKLKLYLTKQDYSSQLDFLVQQRTNHTYSMSLMFNHVTKEDMIKLSDIFRDFANIL